MPIALVNRLSPDLLDRWLGRRIFAVDAVGDGEASFWDSLGVLQRLDASYIDSRTDKLRQLLFEETNSFRRSLGMVFFLAAFHEANRAAPGGSPLHPAPAIIPTCTDDLASRSLVRVPSDFFKLPEKVRHTLESFIGRGTIVNLDLQRVLARGPGEEAGTDVRTIWEQARACVKAASNELRLDNLFRDYFRAGRESL